MEKFLIDNNNYEKSINSKDRVSSVDGEVDRSSNSDFEASFEDLNRMLHTSALKLTKGKDIWSGFSVGNH